MIGFSQDLKLFRKQNLEGIDTKRLQKHELHELVSSNYILPPLNSKGLTPDNLLQAKNKEVFLVTNEEFNHFKYRLSKSMAKKVGVINNALLVRKLNLLLRDRGEKQLGYTEYDLLGRTGFTRQRGLSTRGTCWSSSRLPLLQSLHFRRGLR